MRLRWKLTIVAVLLAIAALYGEFVLDLRIARANLLKLQAISTNISVETADIHRVAEAMRKKYGPDTETVLQTKPARLIARVNGKVVAEEPPRHQFADALGMFVVGPPGHRDSTFPFDIDPRKVPKLIQQNEPSARFLKSRYGKEAPDKYFDFDDRDVLHDSCMAMTPDELGWPGKLLRFQSGTFCLQFWKGREPASMLIGVALADGDPWMRPFTRRICRWLTSRALARLARADGEPPPDYAACVLVDRPQRSGATETLMAHVYQVRRDGGLVYAN